MGTAMRTIRKKYKISFFDIANYTFLIVVGIITLYPFWHEINISLSSTDEVLKGGLFLLPKKITLLSYKAVIGGSNIWRAYGNSIFTTVMKVLLGVFFTALTAYPISRKQLYGRKAIIKFIIFTMLFNGGMIPTYLVVYNLGLVNSLWALVIPTLIAGYNTIIMKSFFQSIPAEIEESAYMDGANPFQIFFRIIVPLSKPVLATIALWVTVATWNNFLGALIYLNDRIKYTLPIFIREIIQGQQQQADAEELREISLESIRAATIMISVLPVICIYPFIQKYFVKGVMIGAVKG